MMPSARIDYSLLDGQVHVVVSNIDGVPMECGMVPFGMWPTTTERQWLSIMLFPAEGCQHGKRTP
jgi:hypothetical protein